MIQKALLALETRHREDPARQEIVARARVHSDPNVQFLAARLDPEDPVGRMLDLVRSSSARTGIRISALSFVAAHAPRAEAINVGIEALRSESDGLRREAIRVLGKLRAKEAIPVLFGVCRQVEGDCALTMARSLEQIGGEEIEPALIQLLELPDIRVRLRTLEALERFGTTSALEALHLAASTPPRTNALRRALEQTRARILERSFSHEPDGGRLSVAVTGERGLLSESGDQGALSVPES